jgi:hypothetical protein
MNEPLKWLPDADGTPWATLGTAIADGLPVPNGFIVFRRSAEPEIRSAYEELKLRERTHFLAVRGSSHAVLNVIGPDQLIHTLRRLWSESPDAPVLVQRMIHAMWCGKAHWHRKNLRVRANEGMLILDADTYLLNGVTGKCIRKTLEPKQRKMIRHVDGSARTVEREGDRAEMSADQLKAVASLASLVKDDIGWAIDDLDRIWLISRQNTKGA